jgi:hypothetical protein
MPMPMPMLLLASKQYELYMLDKYKNSSARSMGLQVHCFRFQVFVILLFRNVSNGVLELQKYQTVDIFLNPNYIFFNLKNRQSID